MQSSIIKFSRSGLQYALGRGEEGVIPLTAADSDFPPAPEISQAMIDYIQGGYFCYTPTGALRPLKRVWPKPCGSASRSR